MPNKRLITLLGLITLAACTDRTPTADESSADPDATPSFSHNGGNGKHKGWDKKGRGENDRDILTNIPISQDGFTGTLSITRIAYDRATNGLLFSGTVRRQGSGVKDHFVNVPGTLSKTAGTGSVGSMEGTRGVTVQQAGFIRQVAYTPQVAFTGNLIALQGPGEPDVCDVLFLNLGPLNLDLLGLVLDLSLITIDLDAVAGAGNLLGNLLCAVVGLLDGPPAVAGVTSLLTNVISNLLA